jgi:hypothetical protein
VEEDQTGLLVDAIITFINFFFGNQEQKLTHFFFPFIRALQSNLDLHTPLFTYFRFPYYIFKRITLNRYSNLIYILHLMYSNSIYVLSKVRISNTGVCILKYKGHIQLHGDFGESVPQDFP